MPTFTARDGTRLYYVDEGEGLPVLALPGLTRNGGDFDHVARHLRGVRLVRLDARGRGRSDRTGPATYTVPQEAEDVLALMDHLGLARAAILGTSRGGIVGMMLGATAPGRLLGLFLNDIGPVIEVAGLDAIADHLGRPPAESSWAEAAAARALRLTGFEGVPSERWLHEVRNQYAVTPEGLELRYDPRLSETFRAPGSAPPPPLWPWFDALPPELPVAVLRGATSDLLAAATVEEMRRRRPGLLSAEVPGRGHVPFLDEPESLGLIGAWLPLCRAREAA